jgi:hypothetical protein
MGGLIVDLDCILVRYIQHANTFNITLEEMVEYVFNGLYRTRRMEYRYSDRLDLADISAVLETLVDDIDTHIMSLMQQHFDSVMYRLVEWVSGSTVYIVRAGLIE